MLKLNNQKIVWIYWGQGWTNAPLISKLCLQSWYNHNSLDYLIMPIDDIILKNYLDLEEMMPETNIGNIDRVALSDIIRLAVLKIYGGIWVDSTVLCLSPLKLWLDPILESHSFFAYDKHTDTVAISSWLLAAKYNNYIINRWFDSTIRYWQKRQKKHIYFWVHELFNNLYKSDLSFKEAWDKIPKLTSSVAESEKLDGPHAFVPYHTNLCSKLSEHKKTYINQKYNNNFCLKLTRHFNINNQIYNKQSTINYILKTEGLI